MIPDRQACLDLLDVAGCEPEVIEHVQAVAELAGRMAEHAPAARAPVVQAGALLHDIGRAFDHGVDHVPKGVAFLREHGIDPAVVACVARHMGAGIRAEQAEAWGWPDTDTYEPETLEERIVCHADNLTRGTEHVGLATVEARFRQRGLEAEVGRLRALEAHLVEQLGVNPSELAVQLEKASGR